MGGSFGGIGRFGLSSSYHYFVVSGRENNPVNFVSYRDAMRFVNWLHNGQPSGSQDPTTTEDGAYTITNSGLSGNTITRNTSARWAITSEDEWYKAAYHQPAAQGGDSDDYWLFPTSSNNAPTSTSANFLGTNTMPVGSYTPNFYGTFDMAGNVLEWNEANLADASYRGVRGGSFSGISFDYTMQSDYRNAGPATGEDAGLGFRVSHIPAPSAAALLGLAGLIAVRRRR